MGARATTANRVVAIPAVVVVLVALILDADVGWPLLVVLALLAASAVPVLWVAGRDWSENTRIAVRTAYWVVLMGALPLVTNGPPERWTIVTLGLVAAAVFQYGWRQRLVVALLMLVVTGLSVLVAGGAATADAVAIGVVIIAWLLVSRMRISLRRRIADARRARVRSAHARRVLGAVTDMATLDPEAALDAVADAIVAVGFPTGGIGELVDGRIRHVAQRGAPGVPDEVAAGTGVTGRALAENRTIVVEDYRQWSGRWELAPGQIGSLIATPLRVEGEVVGVLTGGAFEPRAWTSDDVAVLESLAARATRALEILRTYRRDRELARRLTELDRMKSAFLGGVSEEFRAPLTTIQGVAGTLVERLGSLDGDTTRQLLERLLAQSRRLEVLVGDLVQLAGRRDVDRGFEVVEVDVARVVADGVREVGGATGVGVELTVVGAAHVEGDAHLLTRAIRTLLEDAAAASAGLAPVQVRVERESADVVVSIAPRPPGDHGPEARFRKALVDHALAAHDSVLLQAGRAVSFRLRGQVQGLSGTVPGGAS